MFSTPVKLVSLGLLFIICANATAEGTDLPKAAASAESVQQPAATPQVEALKESVLTLNREAIDQTRRVVMESVWTLLVRCRSEGSK